MDEMGFFDAITDRNEFLAIAKKRGFKIDSLSDRFDKENSIILRKAENGELDAKSYIRMQEESIKKMEKYLIYFKDEDAYFDTLKVMDPRDGEDRIKHEKHHLKKIRKYGLRPHFIIVANCELTDGRLNYIPAVSIADLRGLGEKAGWDLEKIIKIDIDIADIEDKSEDDIKRIQFLKRLLSIIGS